ncbi:FAD-binding oxidoreductase [Silvanigrella sp.]|jgi:D-lactate dehydrogenase|uniref:FAD-binding oxidoreductase n=1 Tax=Silvanigrella sp. TaxID=2024976 RepID=UPI0037C62F37
MIAKEKDNNFKNFLKFINQNLPKKNILSDPLSLYSYANDASHYYLVPKLVLIVDEEVEIQCIFKSAKKYKIPLTIRAAGSSLSGQSITDSVLLVISWKWRKYKIFNEGNEIELQAGVIGKDANYYLAKYKKKIGPDPSSLDFAKIGGIAANNASGMCCGVKNNSYHTLKNIRVIFSNGTILDTSDKLSIAKFKNTNNPICEKILEIRKNILSNSNIIEKIQNKYKIKNTVGYSLNSFVDFEDPIDIISHLMIGSEGTLGFISSITYKTIYEEPYKKAALCFFADLKSAMEAVLILNSDSISSLEFLDATSISCAKKELSEFLSQEINTNEHCLLIIDLRDSTEINLNKKILDINKKISLCQNVIIISKFYENDIYQKIMKIRKSILPIVQSQRKPNYLALLEDVAFPLEHLPQGSSDLKKLFKQHGFENSCLFGHAKDGNLHFILEMKFENENDRIKYEIFMKDLATLVIDKHNGSLKAEHGTGRNIAPFIEAEWGKEINDIMYKIKQILDPEIILNPDVILSADKFIHTKNLKQITEIDEHLDKCNECGACGVLPISAFYKHNEWN